MKKLLLTTTVLSSLLFLSVGKKEVVAQSVPFSGTSNAIAQGKVWTPSQWQTAWASKLDYNNPTTSPFIISTVKGDGVTSDDIQLATDIATCSARGTKLLIPPGKILISGNLPINIFNCHIEGVGVPGADAASTASFGTTFILTSTSIKPFQLGNNSRISGVNFYYPNQTTGAVVYPPTITIDNTTGGATNWAINDVVVVNAYDFIQHTIGAEGGGMLYDSTIYCVHSCWESPGHGDQNRFSNIHFTPGPWLRILSSSLAVRNAIDTASLHNIIFHPTANLGVGNNLNLSNISAFSFRYGFYLENNALVNITAAELNFDGVGTVIDSSSGGIWSGGNRVTGTAICYIHQFAGTPTQATGNAPCFNMGPVGSLTLGNFNAQVRGSFLVTSGSDVVLNLVQVGSIGSVNDGDTYAGVVATANPGGLQLHVGGDSSFAGPPGNTHTFGVLTTPTVASRLTVSNTGFINLNRPIEMKAASTSVITNNWSIGTVSDAAIAITGSDANHTVMYHGNAWDKLPVATTSSCGTSPSTVSGTFSGFFTLGGGALTTCRFTLPWFPFAASNKGPACQFSLRNTTSIFITSDIVVASNPPAFDLTCSANCTSADVYFNCPGWN